MPELVGLASLAAGAGVATFFSPCAYALLPGYVGYYAAATDGETAPLGGALVRGFAATVGVLVVFAALSGITLLVGESIGRVLPVVEPLVALALIALGLSVLRTGSLSLHVLLPERRSSVVGFGVFGAMYALAATACVLPVFLGIALQSLTMAPAETMFVLGSYAGSFGVLMLGVTVATAVGHGLGTQLITGYSERIMQVAGVLLVLAGIGQLYVAMGG